MDNLGGHDVDAPVAPFPYRLDINTRHADEQSHMEKMKTIKNAEQVFVSAGVVGVGTAKGFKEDGDINRSKLGWEACNSAVADWGRPLSHITHIVSDLPIRMVDSNNGEVLGNGITIVDTKPTLPSLSRGCILSTAKQIAESSPGARVLAVCCNTEAFIFTAEDKCNRLFEDGKAIAMVIGSVRDDDVETETVVYGIVETSQSIYMSATETWLLRKEDVMRISAEVCSNSEGLLDDPLVGCALTGVRAHSDNWNPGVTVEALLLTSSIM